MSLGLPGCTAKGPDAGSPQPPGAGDSPASKPLSDPRYILPTAETIASGAYSPLSRPLYLYVNRASLVRPEVAAFLAFFLGDAQRIVPEVGYIRLPDATLKESQAVLQEATGAGGATDDLSGSVAVDGSSTVYLISQAVAEDFQLANKKVSVQVGRSGTGGGFKRFVVGEKDINGASRPIDPREIELCKANNIEYIELKIAIDGLSVVVNQANDWCGGLSVAQLKQIWEPDSKITRWSDLDPKWPAEEIRLFGADSDSGTFDYFTEVIVGKAKSSRSDYNASGDDNMLVTGVKGDKYSLGYFGYAYYVEHKDSLKVLGVMPTEDVAGK